jgi:molybdenum cofactor biosynthesis enzyme MoaA
MPMANTSPAINLSIYNFKQWRAQPPQDFDVVRFDSNNDCNIHCVYCLNIRSKAVVDIGEFRAFLAENVSSANVFQFGCRMEPTLDNRLAEFMQCVAHSPAKPRRTLRLQTNAILLHRHDPGKMRESGLNFLTVSMDTVDPAVFKRLRGGASVGKVLRNVAEFHKACPTIAVAFVTTVTSANINLIDSLIDAGLERGVSVFNLRQVVYDRANPVVDHSLMPDLILSDEAYAEMSERVRAKYGKVTCLCIQDAPGMRTASKVVRAQSMLPTAEAALLGSDT